MKIIDRIRYARYRWRYINGPKLRLRVPVDLSLELTSACTNQCGYCYHGDPKSLPFDRGFMRTDVAMLAIAEAARIGVNSLKFNYRGESTMHQSFKTITEYAKSKARGSVFIDRITNSNFNFKIDRNDIFEGLANQTKVKVSFDSFDAFLFEKQRKGSNFFKTIDNISKFYHWKDRTTELVIQCVRTMANKDEDFHYEVERRWPGTKVSIRDCVEGRINKDLSDVVMTKRDTSTRQSCIQAHVRMIIGHDGKVHPCCPSIKDDLIIGQFPNQSLEQIFNSQKARLLRMDLKSGLAFLEDPCKTCSSFETYKGYKPVWTS